MSYYNDNDNDYSGRQYQSQGQGGQGQGQGQSASYYDPRNSYTDPPSPTTTAAHASQIAGPEHDSSLFSSALSYLSPEKRTAAAESPLDESSSISAHQALYGHNGNVEDDAASGNGNGHTEDRMGAAAALEALKLYATGGNQEYQSSNIGAGGRPVPAQNEFVGAAMAQAAKLFDRQSAAGLTAPSATKQNVVTSAAETAMKLYFKSQISGGGGGGGGGGGAGALLNLATKHFL
ncbi:MAG: hypothetical protein M1825_002408 [Sarcosagium campestre]|nr:MAG: hypothetical protein M1825_002408 [Sarcosagium campestre]